MAISTKTLRDADWKQVYQYNGLSMTFATYACVAIPDLTITHHRSSRGRTVKTTYRVFGKTTDSPTQAVRIYNAEQKVRATGGREAAGSVEQIKKRKRADRPSA